MSYEVDKRVQMRLAHKQRTDSDLDIHEMRDDGHPRCGRKPDSWQGNPMVPVKLGLGVVTCLSCARITGHDAK